MNIILLIIAVLCFAVKILLELFGGSAGKLDLLTLGLLFFAASFLFK